MANADALFGMDVGGATSSPAMQVAYGADGTPVYKSVNSSSSPSPYHHHQTSSATTISGGGEVPSQAAMHGLNMNVVEGGSDHHHHQHQHQQQQQQQQPPMAMMMKKRRGRPRKYGGGGGGEGTDGTMSLALMPSPNATTTVADGGPPPQAANVSGGAFSSPPGGLPGSSFKKPMGRPRGSTNKIKNNNKLHQHIQPLQLGSAGFGFTPHVISVKAGEDVSSKIMSFSQNGPRAVCILSANGAISNVTLRQAATSGGTATYEGRFEILSLCGSFLLTEVGGQRSRTGGLSVSLAGPDGRVLGGCVAGLLTAASPVQVIVGSFIPDGRKESQALNHHTEPTHLPSPPPQNPMPMSMQPMLFQGGGGHVAVPPTTGVSESSQGGSLSDSSGGEGGSPPNHSTGGTTTASNHHHHHNNNNSHPQGLMGMPWR